MPKLCCTFICIALQVACCVTQVSAASFQEENSVDYKKWEVHSEPKDQFWRLSGAGSKNINFGRNDIHRTENAVEPPLRIGSFNIQTLGKKKFNNIEIMITVERVVLRYDLIAVLEVMVNERFYITNFLEEVNRLAPKGVVYNVSISSFPDHPNSTTFEQVVFFYRTDKLKVLHSEMYPNAELKFYRAPYIVKFSSPTLRDMHYFMAVGLHVKPSQAVQEIDSLATVYDYIRDHLKIEDVLIMGDFNADCSYVSETRWNDIDLWTRDEFIWPIGHHIDTTTNHRSCALDRFVFAGSKMEDGVIMSSAQVFNFQDAYGLTTSETRAVSDHWPIEIQIRGKMSDAAEKYLSSEVCVNVKDSRNMSVSANDIVANAKTIGYVAKQYSTGFILRNVTYAEEDVSASLSTLDAAFPNLLTHEQIQGILYKIQYETLLDPSSYADMRTPEFVITVRVDNSQCTVYVCRKTTIN